MEEIKTQEVETKALTVVDQAKAVKVTDSETYTAAGILWKSIGDMIKEVKDTFDPICEASFRAHKEATTKRAKYLDPLTAVQKSVKSLMSTYDAQQEAIRQAEQRRLEEIARKEEDERRRVELERIEVERKAEEDRLWAAAVAANEANNAAEAETLMAAAIIITEDAKQEAAAVMAEPIYVAPVVIPKDVPKMQGGPVFQKRWDFEIVNEAIIPRQYLTVDLVKIRQIVTALKSQTNIPGVKTFEKRV